MAQRLVIAQVGAFPFPLHQGSQVYVRGMAGALARAGHRVIVACWAGGSGDAPPGVEVRRTPRMPFAVDRSGPHWTRLPQDVALIRALRGIEADVVHAHNVEAPVAAWIARRTPIVYDQHTLMSVELPSFFSGWKARAAAIAGAAVDRVVPRLCDAAVALSEEGAAHLRSVGVDVVHLPPAVDPADLDGADAERARARWDLGDGPWVAYTGNTDAYQDLPVWFSAMANVDAGLLMVTGDDPGPWRARAQALGLRHRIVSSTDFADARDALAAASIAVSPRARCAGFPIKLLNHAGLGVPTVAAEGSAREGLGVVAVPGRDPGAMAEAIRALLGDDARRHALGQAARAEVRRSWTWDARVPALEALYRRLGRRGGRG